MNILILLFIYNVLSSCELKYKLIYNLDAYEVFCPFPQFCQGNITIPSEHPENHKPVIRIGSNAFKNSLITMIEFPNSIIEIGNYSFYECKELIELNLPNSLQIIGNQAFYSCKKITQVILPNSVISIGNFVFGSCTGLKTVQLSESLTNLSAHCFADTGLISINFPPRINVINEYAFSGCTNLKNITFNSSPIIRKYALHTYSSTTIINMFGLYDFDEMSCSNINFNNLENETIYVTPSYQNNTFCGKNISIINEQVEYLCKEEEQNKCKEYYLIITSQDFYRNNINICFLINNKQMKFIYEHSQYYFVDCFNLTNKIKYYSYSSVTNGAFKVRYSSSLNNIVELIKIITSYCSSSNTQFILNQFGVSKHQYSDNLCSSGDSIIDVYSNGDIIDNERAIITPLNLQSHYIGTNSMYYSLPITKPILSSSNKYIFELISDSNARQYEYKNDHLYTFNSNISTFIPSNSLVQIAYGNECISQFNCTKDITKNQFIFTTSCVDSNAFRTIDDQIQLVKYSNKNCFKDSFEIAYSPSINGIILIGNQYYFIEVIKKDSSAETVYGIYSNSYIKTLSNICIQIGETSSFKYVYGFYGITESKLYYKTLYSNSAHCNGSFTYQIIDNFQLYPPQILTKGKIGYFLNSDLKCTLEGIEKGYLTKYFNIEQCVFHNTKYLIVKDQLVEYQYSNCNKNEGKKLIQTYSLNKCNEINEYIQEYVGFIITFNCSSKFTIGCLTCDSIECLSCSNNLFLKDNKCQNCSDMYGLDCISCDINTCLKCKTNKLLNGKCIIDNSSISPDTTKDNINVPKIICISLGVIGCFILIICTIVLIIKIRNKKKNFFTPFNKLK
ncbi:leucine rich repeat protein, bspa family protein [Entamoeba histolytica HM-3:IMSS]|uniref:Leucine rich repeat protein, bspa family protein n=1 Tax=Entamoeba histolytica HM-3:IMSS TaxID=885315 RepID=M7WN36_ENTHI|nr:leucine rich repeat protein, bspa family protein [Entamoeba histolytica HM-3:IMSS]